MSKIKLSVEKVRNIRRLYKTGFWTHLMISKRYKVSRGHITKVINKMRWDEKNYPQLKEDGKQKRKNNIH
jgi:NifB/MoaA-like Fe-S oxidoreductase